MSKFMPEGETGFQPPKGDSFPQNMSREVLVDGVPAVTIKAISKTGAWTFSLKKTECFLFACKECKSILPVTAYDGPVLECECGHKTNPAESIKFTHGLRDYGIWVPYTTGWRLKDRYDVMLNNGDIVHQTYPNGRSFNAFNASNFPDDPKHDRIEDSDVLMIRLTPDVELKEKYTYRGGPREERNFEYFGDALLKEDQLIEINGVKCILC